MKKALNQKIYKDLSEIVGENYIAATPLATFAYSQDASIFGGTQAEMVVRPGSTEEVSKIVALANQHRIPLVVRGGGASIYGQPKGLPGSNLLIDMTRMNKVLTINPESFTATAQCGIIMGKLQYECRKEGFYIYSPFAPLHIVSLGGWIAGAAGAAGLWRDIISLTIVLPDGTIVKTGGGPGTNIHQSLFYNRNLGGPDFTGLFIGDGGSFGIKTEATVRITKFPTVMRVSIFEFNELSKVLAMVKRHLERVDPHPFDPIMVFGPGAMKNFMPEFSEINSFIAQGIMQGHTEKEMDAKYEVFNALAEELGGTRTPMLDAMAEVMTSSTSGESGMEMDWLKLFNVLGLPAWLPFTLPREGFLEVYNKLIAWRNARLGEATSRGFEYGGTWEFFTPSDSSTLIGEIDSFFKDAGNPEVVFFVQTMMRDFQEYAHQLGSIDVYNQGLMSNLHARYWPAGFKYLYTTIKASLDPNNILNPDLWTSQKHPGRRPRRKIKK